MSTPTPGQALSPDPADFAYHVRATAFNVLTGKMAGDEWSVPRSERDAIARAVVDAVEPLIRADERAVAAQEPHAAPLWPDGAPVRDADGEDAAEPKAAPGQSWTDSLPARRVDGPVRVIEQPASVDDPRDLLREAVAALAALLDRTEGSTSLTDDERDEYWQLVGALRYTLSQPAPELAAAMAALEKVVSSHERVMYAAAIDIRHGQPGEARRLLGEQLDGWDGPEWDGTETGAQYLERTREVS